MFVVERVCWRIGTFGKIYFWALTNGRNSKENQLKAVNMKILWAIKHLWNTTDKLGEMTENNRRITQAIT